MITFLAVLGLVFTIFGAIMLDVISLAYVAEAGKYTKFGIGADWLDYLIVYGLLIASGVLWALAVWQPLVWAGVA